MNNYCVNLANNLNTMFGLVNDCFYDNIIISVVTIKFILSSTDSGTRWWL